MMYAILLLILLFLLSYVLVRWLRMVLAEGRDAAREALHVARGGKTPQTLIADARSTLAREECAMDFVMASTQAGHVAEQLGRERHQEDLRELPVGLLFALAIDVGQGRLYLRGIDLLDDHEVDEFERIHRFSAVIGIDRVENPFSSALAPDAQSALRIVILADDEELTACMPLEPAWRIRASDLVARIRSMVEDRQRPDVTPVIVQ